MSISYYFWGESRIWILFYYILINYFIGLWIERTDRNKKNYLIAGVILNLVPMLYYKYGYTPEITDQWTDQWVVPLGISFFGFQGISYITGVSQRLHESQKNIFKFAFFKSFFPPLIAGPIFRYSNIKDTINTDFEVPATLLAGIERFIRGLAKKVLIADQLSGFVDIGFKNPQLLTSGQAWLVLVVFSMQIYFDFSGYSDMAIGLHECFGQKIPNNFNQPFQARSLTEFWRRWHMTLSTWFRDYLYIPLGGNRNGLILTTVNKFIVFIICGLWHGGTWLFAIWGLYHGVFLFLESFVGKRNILPAILADIFGRFYVLIAVSVSWIFFRSLDEALALILLKKIFLLNFDIIAAPTYFPELFYYFNPFHITCLAIALLWSLFPISERFRKLNNSYSLHLILFALSCVFLIGSSYQPFIYFRF